MAYITVQATLLVVAIISSGNCQVLSNLTSCQTKENSVPLLTERSVENNGSDLRITILKLRQDFIYLRRRILKNCNLTREYVTDIPELSYISHNFSVAAALIRRFYRCNESISLVEKKNNIGCGRVKRQINVSRTLYSKLLPSYNFYSRLFSNTSNHESQRHLYEDFILGNDVFPVFQEYTFSSKETLPPVSKNEIFSLKENLTNARTRFIESRNGLLEACRNISDDRVLDQISKLTSLLNYIETCPEETKFESVDDYIEGLRTLDRKFSALGRDLSMQCSKTKDQIRSRGNYYVVDALDEISKSLNRTSKVANICYCNDENCSNRSSQPYDYVKRFLSLYKGSHGLSIPEIKKELGLI